MSQILNDYLSSRLPLPNVAAWGARLSDRRLSSRSYKDWLPEPRIEQTVARLAQIAESLLQHDIRPLRLCWTFELARIHLAFRPDGNCLVIFLEKAPGAFEEHVQAILQEFLTLPAV